MFFFSLSLVYCISSAVLACTFLFFASVLIAVGIAWPNQPCCTSWFKLDGGNCLPHECHSQYLVKMVNIWYLPDPHDKWKKVAWPFFFFNDLGLSLGVKLVSTIVSTNDRLWKCFHIIQACFQTEANATNAPHFARTGWRYSNACLQNYLRQKLKVWTSLFCSIQQNIAKNWIQN